MVRLSDRPAGPPNAAPQPQRALPPAAGGSISASRLLMVVLVLAIGIAAITGVAMAVTSGQPAMAIAIGLVAGAFFCRVGC